MVVVAALAVPAAVGAVAPAAVAVAAVAVVSAVAVLVAVPVAVPVAAVALRLAVVSEEDRRVLVAAVVAVVAVRPGLSAGLVALLARAASPSGRSARSSTTCRRRRSVGSGCRGAAARPSGCVAAPH
jgi:hypothetical protein